MKKTALIIFIIAISVKMLSFFRELMLAYFYGANVISDSYIVSTTIPLTIFTFFSTTIISCYIPIYTRIKHENGIKKANEFNSNLILLLIIICSFVVLFVLFFTEFIINLFASGFDFQTKIITINFTRITILSLYPNIILSILKANLNANKKFIIPSVAPIIMNLMLILTIILSIGDINFLPAGYFFSILIQISIYIPYLIKNRRNFKINKDFLNSNIKEFIYLAIPILIGVLVNDLNVIIDKNIASNIMVGGVSIINYSLRISTLIQGLFITTLITLFLPLISEIIAKNDNYKLNVQVNKTLEYSSFILIPASIGILFFSNDLVQIIYQRGSFTVETTEIVSSVLTYYSIGVFFAGMIPVMTRIFYAFKRTKIVMYNSFIIVMINIILNLLLYNFTDLGINGLALSTSVSFIIGFFILYSYLIKISDKLFISFFNPSLLKIIFASSISVFIGYLLSKNLFKIIFNDFFTRTFVSFSFVLIIYLCLIYFLKLKYVKSLFQYLSKIFLSKGVKK